jgi:site-specific recombinase XerD
MKNKAVSDQDVKALLKTVGQYKEIAAQRDVEWIKLLLNTGVRVECLTLLSVDDAIKAINTNYLTLRAETTKGSKEHTLYCNTKARAAFANLLAIRQALGIKNWELDGRLILSRHHQGISVRSIQSRLNLWVKAAGIERKISPHDLRHTFGTRILKRATHPDAARIAQEVLNHSDPRTTAIYTQPTPADIEDTLEAVGQ